MYERSMGLRNGSRSPMPLVRLACRKKGRSNCSGLITNQTFSSLLYRLKNPGCSLASFTTSANGFCWPATATAAAATVVASGAGSVAHPKPNADAVRATSTGTRCKYNGDIESVLREDVNRCEHPLLPASAEILNFL